MLGFSGTWSNGSGSTSETFGDCTSDPQPDDLTGSASITRAMYYSTALDTDDIEGLAFIGYSQN